MERIGKTSFDSTHPDLEVTQVSSVSSIDQMSLAALIIALGMLVDNGIVIAEEIQPESAGSPYDMVVVQNWLEELKRRVPTDP